MFRLATVFVKQQPVARAFASSTRFAKVNRPSVGRAQKAWESIAPGMSPFKKAFCALAGTGSVIAIGTLTCAARTDVFADALGVTTYTPEYVRQRVQSTYGYVTLGLGTTAAVATVMFRTGLAHRVIAMNPMMFMVGSMAGTIGLMLGTQYTDINTNPVMKHVMWVGFNSAVALSLSTLGFMGGPLLLKAAMGTGVMVGSLSLIAANSPSDQFLWMAGPLTVGLGVVVVSSVGTLFFPASALLHNVCLYGGLGLFGGMVLYDTNKIRLVAERTPPQVPFDPINNSISVYLDTINIFIRIAQILALQKRK